MDGDEECKFDCTLLSPLAIRNVRATLVMERKERAMEGGLRRSGGGGGGGWGGRVGKGREEKYKHD